MGWNDSGARLGTASLLLDSTSNWLLADWVGRVWVAPDFAVLVSVLGSQSGFRADSTSTAAH